MGQLDIKGKEYLSDNKRFADLCNVVLFDGEQIIKAKNLEERDSTEVLSVFGIDQKEQAQQRWRDMLKSATIKTDGTITIVLFGVENQSEIHYALPVKNLIYDALNYGTQVKEAAKRHRENKEHENSAEFLSGLKKSDRLTPVVTITVYWGTEDWDGPRTLYEMFDEKIDSRLLEYIPEYKTALISANTVKDFSKFKSELGLLMEVIRHSTDKKAFRELIGSDQRFKNVDNETVSAINVLTGIQIPLNEKEGKTNMCKAMDDLRMEYIEQGIERGIEQGIERGIEQGIEQGIERGIEQGKEAERLSAIGRMLRVGKTPEQISGFCGYAIEEVLKVQQEIMQTV